MLIPTRKHQLSTAEKAHEYFLREKDEGRAGAQRNTRKRVADCLVFSTDTISKTVADWRAYKDPSFPARDGNGAPLAPSDKPVRGHRPRLDETTVAEDVRTIILEKHAHSKAVTAAIVRNELQDIRTVRRVLRRLGYRYLRGQARIYIHGRVRGAFRARYLRKRRSNRDASGNPIVPEVFLDESFCNLHHVIKRSWLDASRIRFAPRWVDDSLHYWVAKHAKKAEDDYHGNFNTALFEHWFDQLFMNLTLSANGKVAESGHPKLAYAELLELARRHRQRDQYACIATARSWGHRVLYTPPYHPELQPIEVVWAVVKNRIAMDPATTLPDLGSKLESSFAQVHTNTWTGAYRKALYFEDKYLELVDAVALDDDNDAAVAVTDDGSAELEEALGDALICDEDEFEESITY
ncbi:hypothetical protein ACHHYP_11297 [Achlya hypogyna]|uniref:Tc1-like transposase DDE domain-containing protein n=1 Tax=Achlya hypogyna TaxID=1202772 RepID=A0A1V9YJF5_ACHHY|nr:hypothetical protein ACHHYP_11297 [Achlya hypogyna]